MSIPGIAVAQAEYITKSLMHLLGSLQKAKEPTLMQYINVSYYKYK
jgi:hypothetical protein